MNEEEYNFYDEDINKTNVVKWLILLLLIGCMGVGYFVYQDYLKKQSDKVEDLSIPVTDPEVQNLYQQYNVFTTSIGDHSLYLQKELFGYYYLNQLYTTKTISNEAKLVTALNALFINQTIPYTEESTEPIEVKGEVVREMITTLFGPENAYQNVSLDPTHAVFCQFGELVYDEATDVYKTEGEGICTGKDRPLIKTRLTSAKKDKDVIYLTEEMAYLVPEREEDNAVIYNVYDEMEAHEKTLVDTINTQSEFAFYKYKHLHKYEYTFRKKDQGQDYYLEKVSRVK